MGYRPEPKLGCGPIVFLLIVLFFFSGIGYFEETKPHNDHIKQETKKMLDTAHKEAVNSVDTLDLKEIFVNTESANKDSARLATKMLDWMKQQGENPRFCDYKHVYDTISMKNGETGFKLSKYPWRLNINKAMKDTCFANNYNQYKKSIITLETARRKQNQK